MYIRLKIILIINQLLVFEEIALSHRSLEVEVARCGTVNSILIDVKAISESSILLLFVLNL